MAGLLQQPYTYNSQEYYFYISPNESGTAHDVLAYCSSLGNKIITRTGAGSSVAGCLKSPYEERLAVIINAGVGYQISGCHLKTRFSPLKNSDLEEQIMARMTGKKDIYPIGRSGKGAPVYIDNLDGYMNLFDNGLPVLDWVQTDSAFSYFIENENEIISYIVKNNVSIGNVELGEYQSFPVYTYFDIPGVVPYVNVFVEYAGKYYGVGGIQSEYDDARIIQNRVSASSYENIDYITLNADGLVSFEEFAPISKKGLEDSKRGITYEELEEMKKYADVKGDTRGGVDEDVR